MEAGNPLSNPYVGPRPFALGEEKFFFGRNREINNLINLIFAYSVVLLNAQSGAGKTSLVNAGIIPKLSEEGHKILRARIRDPLPAAAKPDAQSNFFVFKTLVSWNGSSPDKLTRTSFKDYLKNWERPVDADGEPLLRVLIFDQFEDIFTSHLKHWKDRQGFFAQLGEALVEDSQLRLMFVMREEYVSRLGAYADLLPDKLRVRYYLEHLRHDAAVNAIVLPLKNTKRSCADDAAQELVVNLSKIRVDNELIPGEFVEPVQLQIVCQNLWQRLPPEVEVINRQHLADFGDVSQALSGFYERSLQTAVERTKVSERDLREWIEHHLITSEGTPGIVHRGNQKTEGMPNAVIDVLEELRLIRGEPRAGIPWYELAHDRFVVAVQSSNRNWRERWEYRWPRILAVSLVSILMLVVVGVVLASSQAAAAQKVADATLQFNIEVQSDWVATRVLGLGGIPTVQLTQTPSADFLATATAQAQTWQPRATEDHDVTMVYVPQGCFWMGNQAGEPEEQSVFETCIETPYWIDQNEVTKADFDIFGTESRTALWDDPLMPRTIVKWAEALRYCKTRNPNARLPTEVEWEYAARGPNSLLYPWGNVFIGDQSYVVYAGNIGTEEHPIPFLQSDIEGNLVASRAEGASWVGAHDMSGNVREWTMTVYDKRFSYPNIVTPEANTADDMPVDRIARGGGYLSVDGRNLTTASRNHAPANEYYKDIGFRCMLPAQS
jgi:formylglycine-generating enzyme required for sulfatase activity